MAFPFEWDLAPTKDDRVESDAVWVEFYAVRKGFTREEWRSAIELMQLHVHELLMRGMVAPSQITHEVVQQWFEEHYRRMAKARK